MSSATKIIRDPLYNYIAIDLPEQQWLLDLIDSSEVQRLRRIHQLGVSHITYPGADHSRFSHTLGVLHLMQQACKRIKSLEMKGPKYDVAQNELLAAAVLHDVGHGPFSHLIEPVLGVNHEKWSCRIISSPDTEVNRVLCDNSIQVNHVVSLIDETDHERPAWQKTLLSSQLDVDRLDYLRRDSYFTGSNCGNFDWYRILNTFDVGKKNGKQILVWPVKAMNSIEEYIFARYYMYNNVYQHKTTRGFEKVVQSAWRRAESLREDGQDAGFVPEIDEFLSAGKAATVKQYLAMEDATLVYQLHRWSRHEDEVLSDLSRRFLDRNCFVAIEDPVAGKGPFADRDEWESALEDLVKDAGFKLPKSFALRDELKGKVYHPYIAEKEEDSQDPYTAIFLRTEGGEPKEISSQLPRLAAVMGAHPVRYRYYVPRECRKAALELAASDKW